MKVLFAGSPESSAMILSSLSREMVDIVGVISQPDKRSSRRKGKEPSAVSKEALKLGIPSYKPIVFDNLFKKEIKVYRLNFFFK